MTRLRYVPGKTRHDKRDGNTQGRGVVEMQVVRENRPCKECGKEPRLNGSSRGQRCKDAYAAEKTAHRLSDSRLAAKIAAQAAQPV